MNFRILILDSSKVFIQQLKTEFEQLKQEDEEFEFIHFNSSKDALNELAKNSYNLIISDIHLKDAPLEGVLFLEKYAEMSSLRDIPFVFISQDKKISLIKEVLLKGAVEYFFKPLDPIDVYKLNNFMKQGYNIAKIQSKMITLSEGMDEAVQVVKEREREIILRLAKAAATRDKETGNHIYRVGQYSLVLARTLGLSFHMQETIEKAAPLHDVGKIAIPDAILQKPSKLTDDEYKVMKNHTIYGYKVLFNPNMELLRVAADVALSHHERWDGKGYPYGKKGEEIPLAARITTVADVFDALVSRRRYKEAFSTQDTFKEMKKEAGTAFDTEVVEALIESQDKILKIYEELKDE